MRLRGKLDYSNPRDSTLLDGLQTSSARLLNTLNDMLDFAQGGHQTQGALLLKNTTFSLHKMVADLGAVFSPLAERKSIAFTTQVGGNVECWLCSDEEKIYRLLSNLISNALKFTPDKGAVMFSVTNHITTTPERNAVASCHFVVSDTGIGLAKGHLQKIFEPFYQVDQGDSRQYQGNGLGLAICQQIAEAVGGRIWVESVPDQGAQFHFTVTMPTVVV
jgi:signal transduction histidine kinase